LPERYLSCNEDWGRIFICSEKFAGCQSLCRCVPFGNLFYAIILQALLALRHEARAIAARSLRCWNPARSLEHLERFVSIGRIVAYRSREIRVAERIAWSLVEAGKRLRLCQGPRVSLSRARYFVPHLLNRTIRDWQQRCLTVAHVKVAQFTKSWLHKRLSPK